MKEKRFVVPCKYSTIDEIDAKTTVVKARNFGFWGNIEITIQL